MNKYFELHCHSHFSYLDGVGSPKDIARRAKELGYEYCAITDHGELSGWYEFSKACKENDIKPIFGCEFYICRDLEDKDISPFRQNESICKRYHLVVQAKGNEGMEALRDLYNNSWKNYNEKGGKQIIFESDLLKHAGKIVVQSGCISSYIDSEEKLLKFKEVFKDDFYLELQPHAISCDYDLHKKIWTNCEDKQLSHNNKLIEWSKKFNVPMIVSGDCHYCRQEDKVIQDIQILNSYVGKKTGWHFHQDTYFMMDKEMWWSRFTELNMVNFTRDDLDKALVVNHEIAKKCVGGTLERPPQLRKFDITTHELYTSGDNVDSLIGKLVKDYGRWNPTDTYKARFKYELKIIKEKGYLDYFFLLEDVVRWNNRNDYLIGPARGSSAGSLFAYYLGITAIDPIKYDLLFERFISVDRSDLPDIDCLDPELFTLTNRGSVKLKDCKEGMQILTRQGYKSCQKITYTTTNKVIRIHFNNQYIDCKPDHKWIVLRDKKEQIVLARDLKNSDFLIDSTEM